MAFNCTRPIGTLLLAREKVWAMVRAASRARSKRAWIAPAWAEARLRNLASASLRINSLVRLLTMVCVIIADPILTASSVAELMTSAPPAARAMRPCTDCRLTLPTFSFNQLIVAFTLLD